MEEQSTLDTIFTDDVGDEDEGLDEDFLKAEGLDDESLEKRQAALEEKQLQDEDAAIAKFNNELEIQELELERDQALADAKKDINNQLLLSGLGLAQALAQAAGDSQQAALAALTFEKIAAVSSIIINTAKANGVLAAQLGVAAPPAIALNNANGAIQVATVLATALPQVKQITAPKKLKDGEVLIQGAGTETSDSIPAMLSKNESVINAKSSKKHTAALKAINNDRFEDYLNRVLVQRLYTGKRDKKEINITKQKNGVKFPDRMSIKNANAISRPIIDKLDEMDFLNGVGWQ
jgi:hypothetical protein